MHEIPGEMDEVPRELRMKGHIKNSEQTILTWNVRLCKELLIQSRIGMLMHQ